MTELLANTAFKVCALVTLAFWLSCTGLLGRIVGKRIGAKERALGLLICVAMALVEEVIAQRTVPMNARVVAVCAAGLLLGPELGAATALVSVGLASVLQGHAPVALGVPTLLAGVLAGVLGRSRPEVALRVSTGFWVGLLASSLRYGATLAAHRGGVADAPGAGFPSEMLSGVGNGLGVSLVLAVLAQVRIREDQAQAAAIAEVRALQARMSPHFLFNALNSISALSTVEPRAVPSAVSRLATFLRGGIQGHDSLTVPLRQELAIVDAYLDVEALRFGRRLRVERELPEALLDAAMPPFSIQPLVENAVRHGIEPSADGGLVRLSVARTGVGLSVFVHDTGGGFDASAPFEPLHAIDLLRRRLKAQYGAAASLEIHSGAELGTTAILRVPYVVDAALQGSLTC